MTLIIISIFSLMLLLWLGFRLTPAPLREAREWAVSPALLDGEGRLFHVRLSVDEEYCLPVPLERMGRWLPLVLVEVEDKRFYTHGGVDWLALGRAAWQNVSAWRVRSGASTISSQLIRLAVPRSRTLWSKAREFAQAMALERDMGKAEILELYLNRAPFGGPVRGAEAAALTYFSKRAEELSLAESAMLVALLKGPSYYRPDRNPKGLKERRDYILNQLAERGKISGELLRNSLKEPIPPHRASMPLRNMHYAEQCLRRIPADKWLKGQGPVQTGLDRESQALLAGALAGALRDFPQEVSAAGVLIRNNSGRVLAYVGNQRFEDGAPGSPANSFKGRWVDCADSLRSPGSILKPFAYLDAFERGLLNSGSLLADTPLSFAGRAPKNFDHLYRGPVDAHSALADSLNAPAVRVLRLIGGDSLRQGLRDFGFRSIVRKAGYYGDSLVLGGCEVSLLEVAQAYETLANLGLRRPALFINPDSPGRKLMEQRATSQAGAYLIADILRDTSRLLPLTREIMEENFQAVAFKTGTSYGLRDAWTAAYTPDYTVAIWLGNPDGSPRDGLVGLSAAAPSALHILRALTEKARRRGGAGQRWYTAPAEIEYRRSCALSGMPAGPHCPILLTRPFIRDVSRPHPCSMHVLRQGELTVLWPRELADYAAAEGMPPTPGPRVNISSPRPDSRILLVPGAQNMKLPLACEGARGTVYWYVDKEFFGEQKAGETLFWPLKAGRHVVSALDSTGQSSKNSFVVLDPSLPQPAWLQPAPESAPLLMIPEK